MSGVPEWKCTVCKARVYMNPKTEALYEEKEVEVDATELDIREEPDPLDPKKRRQIPFARKVKKKVRQKFPKMAHSFQQNMDNGAMEAVTVHEHRDLQPRNYIVALRAGGERIQTNVCRKCYTYLEAEVKALKTKIESLNQSEAS